MIAPKMTGQIELEGPSFSCRCCGAIGAAVVVVVVVAVIVVVVLLIVIGVIFLLLHPCYSTCCFLFVDIT